jgi:hypothetical protein
VFLQGGPINLNDCERLSGAEGGGEVGCKFCEGRLRRGRMAVLDKVECSFVALGVAAVALVPSSELCMALQRLASALLL